MMEFIPLAALLTCLTALSIDIMLPVLPDLARDLGLTDPNDQQLVVTSYLGGMVAGQLVVGTVSDRFGRLPVLYAGLALFIVGAAVASLAASFHWLLIARALQGMGGAAPRIITTAVVRDLYAGRQMARIMSMVMTTFIMVPIFAPSLGQLLAFAGGWRAPIMFLALAGTLAALWAWARLPETSPRHAANRADSPAIDQIKSAPFSLVQALQAVFQSRLTVGYIAANGFMIACLMSYILSSQQVFVDVYGLGALFPLAFGAIAVAMAIAGIVNAKFVLRLWHALRISSRADCISDRGRGRRCARRLLCWPAAVLGSLGRSVATVFLLRLDRIEFQCVGHRTAWPCRGHSVVRYGFVYNFERRTVRHLGRSAVRHDDIAAQFRFCGLRERCPDDCADHRTG